MSSVDASGVRILIGEIPRFEAPLASILASFIGAGLTFAALGLAIEAVEEEVRAGHHTHHRAVTHAVSAVKPHGPAGARSVEGAAERAPDGSKPCWATS